MGGDPAAPKELLASPPDSDEVSMREPAENAMAWDQEESGWNRAPNRYDRFLRAAL